jgi:hypothetical protein
MRSASESNALTKLSDCVLAKGELRPLAPQMQDATIRSCEKPSNLSRKTFLIMRIFIRCAGMASPVKTGEHSLRARRHASLTVSRDDNHLASQIEAHHNVPRHHSRRKNRQNGKCHCRFSS